MKQIYYISLVLEFTLWQTFASPSLKLVHVFFRHGERSPTETYINDPYKNYEWPEGWGQLSNKGKLELYNLGILLRERYGEFLTSLYFAENVLMQSSYADRCLVSAQLLLAGLYPPVGDQIWNKDLLWLSIPIHSVPRNLDNKIAMKAPCTVYDEALKSSYRSDHIREIDQENGELYNYLTEHTGQEVRNISAVEFLYNTLEIEDLNGLKLPEWTKTVYPTKMKKLAAEALAIYTDSLLMRRLKGGVLLKEVSEHMKHKAEGTLRPDRQIFLYSAHDISIVNVLRTLGFTDLIKPKFAAYLTFELHEIEKEYFVKLFYQDSLEDELEPLKLNFCETVCPLEKFSDGLKSVIPNDWKAECEQV